MTNKEMEQKIQELSEQNANLQKSIETYKAAQDAEVNTPLVLPDPAITPTVPYEEKEFVKVRLFRDEYRYKQPLYVSINGRNWLIKRGVEVTLPKYVADFIEQQMQEEAAIWERVAKEEQEYKDLTAKQV
jgi:hypothetical protein